MNITLGVIGPNWIENLLTLVYLDGVSELYQVQVDQTVFVGVTRVEQTLILSYL